MDNPIAANVLGTLGAVCWSIQLIPQIYINYRRADTTGLQPSMMLLWACAGVPLGVYNIVQGFNVALQIQPQILTFLSLLTWSQCKFYTPVNSARDEDGSSPDASNNHETEHDTEGSDEHRYSNTIGHGIGNSSTPHDQSQDVPGWSLYQCAISLTLFCGLMAAVEVGLVFALRVARRRLSPDSQDGVVGRDWPIVLIGALSGALLCAGVLRHYWDIYTERTVRGISFVFVGIDALGDLTSLVSVFYQAELDILGMVVYGSELTLWLGVFACGGYYNLRPWLRSKISKYRNKQLDTMATTTDHNRQLAEYQGVMGTEIDRRSSATSGSVFRTASASASMSARPGDVISLHNSSRDDDGLRLRSTVPV